MSHRFWKVGATAGLLALTLSTTACNEDGPSGIIAPTLGSFAQTSSSIRPGSRPSSDEKRAGEELARAFAIALASPGYRQDLKRVLAGSRAQENKLHLAAYLRVEDARVIQAMGYRGVPPAQLRQALERVRDLEIYMPVAQHREQWTGEQEVMVVMAITDDDAPVGYQADGSRRTLDPRMPPMQPVIVITARESNFENQIAAANSGLVARCDAGSSLSLAAAARSCASVAQASPSVSSLKPNFETNGITDSGLYLTFLRVVNSQEAWWRGGPEIEVHVTARAGGQTATQIQCLGQYAADDGRFQPGIRSQSYVFDMNGGFWDGFVLVLSVAQLNSLASTSPSGFNVSVWEDDQDSCENHEEEGTSFADYLALGASVGRGVNAVRVENYGVIAASLGEIANFLDGADQMIGLMVYKDSTAYAGQNPGNTHMLYRGTRQNGRATMVYGPEGYTAPNYGPVTSVVVTPETESVLLGNIRQFEATAFDANGLAVPGVTFSWSSSNSGVAPVASDGTVSGSTSGTATITASGSGLSGAANVTVSGHPVLHSISGPLSMQPNASCMWEAVVSGGSTPYTYQWTNDDTPVGTGSSYTGSKDPGNTSGYLRIGVTVTDASGGSDSHLVYVQETSSASACLY